MRAVVQRVKKATMEINNQVYSTIEKGLVVLLGVMEGDTESQAEFLAKKIAELRIFTDDNDKMNLSATDLQADILVVSNFTLGADCKKGRRPYFVYAAKPDEANVLYEYFVTQVRNDNRIGKVSTGQFGEHMEIAMVADGPVTIVLDTDEIQKK
ncbi:D-aminoacyl-tRNA deacylase [Paludicola sp. MB14-C6]|uniref:D-aminoacyl-tRNA deacylase n=1 Tax=Paludihabitans sp. MB14-C6 TaxID=3070656 RepID=UPI0027DCB3DB|nr:D-aminoacyl-tRNA deacylase [Paludicola sp. MB14-C6]WMJ22389.1 D-aminoacyl-tRNA deacylase [Paludicola sp. MB14-C6]